MYVRKNKKNLSLAEEPGKFSSVSDDQDRDLGQTHWIGSMSRTKTCIPIQMDVTIQQQLDQSSSSKLKKKIINNNKVLEKFHKYLHLEIAFKFQYVACTWIWIWVQYHSLFFLHNFFFLLFLIFSFSFFTIFFLFKC